jgi:DUF4097 and DUF4098 domain-containing protein YvlB
VSANTFRTFTHKQVKQISVERIGAGSVSVLAGPDDYTVEGSVNASSPQLLSAIDVRQDGDVLRIDCSRSAAHLRLAVPGWLGYAITSGSADVSISAPIRRSRIVSGSGDIAIAEAEDLTCSSGSGALNLGQLTGAGARLNTGSGDINVDRAHCPVSAKSGSGEVVVRELSGAALQASSGSGDIDVPSTTGSVDLRSASGSLSVGVADNLPAWLDLSSVSGRIEIALEPIHQPAAGEPSVSVRARTASGSITIHRAGT